MRGGFGVGRDTAQWLYWFCLSLFVFIFICIISALLSSRSSFVLLIASVALLVGFRSISFFFLPLIFTFSVFIGEFIFSLFLASAILHLLPFFQGHPGTIFSAPPSSFPLVFFGSTKLAVIFISILAFFYTLILTLQVLSLVLIFPISSSVSQPLSGHL